MREWSVRLRPKDGAILVETAGGVATTTLLNTNADIAAVPGGLATVTGRLSNLDTPALATLGKHLWRALGLPPDAASASRIEIDLPPGEAGVFLRALPWHLLHDPAAFLANNDVAISLVVGPQDEAPLSAQPHVLVMDAGLRELALPQDWALALAPLAADPQVRRLSAPAALSEGLGQEDVLHLLLAPTDQPGANTSIPLHGAGALRLEALLTAMSQRGAPKILLLDVLGPARDHHARLAARLAEHAPTVILASGAEDPDQSLGPRLLQTMLTHGLSADRACRLVERELGLGPQRWLRCYGGQETPRPAEDHRHARWRHEDGWRVRLDRATQTGIALQHWDDVRELRPGKPSGLIVAWDGDAQSGVTRFLRRLSYELRERRRLPVVEIPLSWPERPQTRAWQGVYEAAFDVSWTAASATIAQAISRRVGHLEHPVVPLILHHGLMGAPLAERSAPEVLAPYLEWWAQKVVPHVPPHIVPVLAVPLEDETPALLPRLKQAMEPRLRGMDLVTWLPLDRLPEVRASDIVKLIDQYDLYDGSREEKQAIADEIVSRTVGRYEPTVRQIEDIPWQASAILRAAYRKQQKPEVR